MIDTPWIMASVFKGLIWEFRTGIFFYWLWYFCFYNSDVKLCKLDLNFKIYDRRKHSELNFIYLECQASYDGYNLSLCQWNPLNFWFPLCKSDSATARGNIGNHSSLNWIKLRLKLRCRLWMESANLDSGGECWPRPVHGQPLWHFTQHFLWIFSFGDWTL